MPATRRSNPILPRHAAAESCILRRVVYHADRVDPRSFVGIAPGTSAAHGRRQMKQPKRPNAVTGVAIFQIVFGVLSLLSIPYLLWIQLGGGTMFFVGGNFPGAAEQQQFQDDFNNALQNAPYYQTIQWVELVVSLVVGTVMIVGGLGLMKMRVWARWLTIGYACFSIVNTLLGFFYNLFYLIPAVEAFLAQERQKPKPPPGLAFTLSIMGPMMTVVTFLTLLIIVYPIVLLIVLFRPHVREAFRGQALAREDAEARDAGVEEVEDSSEKGPEADDRTDDPPEKRIRPREEFEDR
jgi:hypothetical protein